MEQTFSEKLATFLTHPGVMALLLFIGIAGVIIEVIVPGFGAGILGVTAFVLYFFGNQVAGFAGWENWSVCDRYRDAGDGAVCAKLRDTGHHRISQLDCRRCYGRHSTSHVALSLGIGAACALVAIIVVALVFKEREYGGSLFSATAYPKSKGIFRMKTGMYLSVWSAHR